MITLLKRLQVNPHFMVIRVKTATNCITVVSMVHFIFTINCCVANSCAVKLGLRLQLVVLKPVLACRWVIFRSKKIKYLLFSQLDSTPVIRMMKYDHSATSNCKQIQKGVFRCQTAIMMKQTSQCPFSILVLKLASNIRNYCRSLKS